MTPFGDELSDTTFVLRYAGIDCSTSHNPTKEQRRNGWLTWHWFNFILIQSSVLQLLTVKESSIQVLCQIQTQRKETINTYSTHQFFKMTTAPPVWSLNTQFINKSHSNDLTTSEHLLLLWKLFWCMFVVEYYGKLLEKVGWTAVARFKLQNHH